jgi:hypothetical protein
VIEIVSDDWEEYRYLVRLHRNVSSVLKFLGVLLLRRRFLRAASGIITGTYELARKPRFARYVRSAAAVPNSIRLNSDSEDLVKTKESASLPGCNLFFIGSPGFTWHGVDKIERIAEKLGDEFRFHIVGLEGTGRSNVVYHGYLNGEEYDRILAETHICVSTFALHRKQQQECTTIKFCEYVKKGFPVIVPYTETSVYEHGAPEWVLELPNRDDVAELPDTAERIRQFCREQKERIVEHGSARPYIAAESIEEKRLAFMAACAGTVHQGVL